MTKPLKISTITTILLLQLISNIYGQINQRCDSIYYRSFCNFVKYDDSVGYSLNYKISLADQECLTDTVDFINFLLSDRFFVQNQKALRRNKLTDGLGNIHMSFLAHRTDHKKIRPQLDSTYEHISDWKVQMYGNGRQIIRAAPIDVLKFYFISSLFYNDFQFKNEIALIKRNKVVETYTDQKFNITYYSGPQFLDKEIIF